MLDETSHLSRNSYSARNHCLHCDDAGDAVAYPENRAALHGSGLRLPWIRLFCDSLDGLGDCFWIPMVSIPRV